MKQSRSREIVTKFVTMTLAANELRSVKTPGFNYFLLKSNSSATNVQIGIGKDTIQDWPLLYSYRMRTEDEYFDEVNFYNPTGVAMTIQYVLSTGLVDNKSAEVVGTAKIDDTSNGISSPASIICQPRAGFLIDGSLAVDVGGGVVGIPLTGQPFSTGDGVTITNCPQYNGAYTVLASSTANQVDITATFQGGLIDNAAAVDVGGGVVGIPITGHPYATGETITIANTTNYDGSYPVLASSTANQVNITVAYNAETFDGVNDSHNLTFDNADDTIALTTAQMIAGDGTRKEIHITNHDATYNVFWGDSNVDPANYRGVIIAAESVYIITCTDDIYVACEAGAGVTGCRVSWNNLTKT